MRELHAVEVCFVSGGAPFCGPQNSWISEFIPDTPFGLPYGGPCQNHDTRYGEGLLPRSQIDSMFLDEMLLAAGGNLLGVMVAYVYYGFVSAFGGSFYGPQNAGVGATAGQALSAAELTANFATSWGLGEELECRFDTVGITSYFDLNVDFSLGGGGSGDPDGDPILHGTVAVA